MWSVCSLGTYWNLKVQMKIIQFLQFLHLDCAALQRLLPFPYGILKISPSLRMPSLPIELCCSGASFLSMSSFSVQDWMKSLFWLPEQGLAQLGSWQSFVCAALALFRMWLFLRLSFCCCFLPMSCTEPFLQFPLLCWLWDEFALCDSAHEEWGLWRWDRFLWATRHLPKTLLPCPSDFPEPCGWAAFRMNGLSVGSSALKTQLEPALCLVNCMYPLLQQQ